MDRPKIPGTELRMGDVVTVTKELYRGWGGEEGVTQGLGESGSLRLWESNPRSEARAGWVVGVRWLLNGRRIPGSSTALDFTEEYDPPYFRETEPRTPCLLVVYWPTMSPVRVPLDGYELSDLEPECPAYSWSDFNRKEMSKIMEDMPRDARGRWKRILPPRESRLG